MTKDYRLIPEYWKAMNEDHSAIHAAYVRLTGRQMPLSISEHLRWNAWTARGWNELDLILVVDHIKSLIAKGRRHPESFRLYNLIEPGRFSEDLAEARSLARKPRYAPDKASVLRATQRPDEPEQRPARTAEQIMKGDEGLRELLRLRDSL